MKLLIVDDQQAAVQGMARNIPWKEEGFSLVETARNAMEARLAFQRGVPDVMLCDIEMPVENGLQLCTWVREQDYATEIIFLTCHADFQYAKQAIQLNAVDYVVQPVDYRVIREKVRVAVDRLRERKQKEKLSQLGEQYVQQSEISSSLWRGFLDGTVGGGGFSALPNLPNLEQEGYLILIQLVRWTQLKKNWNSELMQAALQNIANEVFCSVSALTLVSYMEPSTHALLLVPQAEASTTELDGCLHYFVDAYKLYMPGELALFCTPRSRVSQMPAAWKKLLVLRDENVADRSGVQRAAHSANVHFTTDYHPQARQWLGLLELQGREVAQTAVLETFDSLEKKGINAAALLSFYQDFRHFLMLATPQESGSPLQEYLFSREGTELMREAIRSVDKMRQLISEAFAYLPEAGSKNNAQVIARQIQDYVREHLWMEIRQEDIVKQLHMSGDYLNRIFKKEIGYTIKSYIIQTKLEEAQRLLRTTSLSVSNVAVQLGYSNFSHFSAMYKQQFGLTPSEEKKKAEST